MKTSFIILLILTSLSSQAQDWQPFLTNRTAFYWLYNAYPNTYVNEVNLVKIDSSAMNGSDVVLYNYKQLDYEYRPCYGTPWSSAYVIEKPNGITLFQTYGFDSLAVKTNASVNDSFVYLTYWNGTFVMAKLASITYENVLGIADSVKNFDLFVHYYYNPTQGYPTYKQLKLSKNFGLVRFYPYGLGAAITTDTTAATLVGLSDPDVGFQIPERAAIFDIQPGDVFHYYCFMESADGTNVLEQRLKDTLISNTISANLDTIHLSFTEVKMNVNWTLGVGYDTTYFNQVVNFTYILSQLSFFDSLPYKRIIAPQFSYNSGYTYYSIDECTQKPVVNNVHFYDYDPLQQCFIEPVGHCIFYVDAYEEGLGKIASFSQGENCHCTLAFFHKGNQVCGSPFLFSIPTTTEEYLLNNSVKIFPNPFGTFINISVQQPGQHNNTCRVTNIFGQQLQVKSFNQAVTVDLSVLPAGIYYCEVTTENGRVIRKMEKQ